MKEFTSVFYEESILINEKYNLTKPRNMRNRIDHGDKEYKQGFYDDMQADKSNRRDDSLSGKNIRSDKQEVIDKVHSSDHKFKYDHAKNIAEKEYKKRGKDNADSTDIKNATSAIMRHDRKDPENASYKRELHKKIFGDVKESVLDFDII